MVGAFTMSPKLKLGATQRLKRNNDFVYTRKNGKTFRCRYFALFSTVRDVSATGYPHPRIGISASKRVGNAIARNRQKRRFREIFRALQGDIRLEVDIVLSIRPPANDASYAELEQLFLKAIQYNALGRARP